MRRDQTETITLRLEKKILAKLRRESEQNQTSLNTLSNQIFRQHIDWHSEGSYGVYGTNDRGYAVAGYTYSGYGGVYGLTYDGLYGVYGSARRGDGVYGISESGVGVRGFSNINGIGVIGSSNNLMGVAGYSNTNTAVFGWSDSGTGVHAKSNRGLAALLEGNVRVTGNLQKGGGSFKIDHPLDPANKYLYHSFVESPDMKNVYDGVVTLDDKGEAEIELPDWFGALNKDFRYQLTAIGAPAPNLHISEQISSDGVNITNYSNSSNSNKNNSSRFKVAGGASGMKVSWQVTGIRKDPWANAHRIPVEEDKPAKERGYYTYPDLYGQPEEKGISRLLFPRDEEKKELLIINDQNKRPK